MVGRVLLFTLVPLAAAAASGAAAALRAPGKRLTSGLQHFAAGVVFAAAAIERLPDVLREDPSVAIAGFAAGIAVMFAFRAAGSGPSGGARRAASRGFRSECWLPPGSTSSSTASFSAPDSRPAATSARC